MAENTATAFPSLSLYLAVKNCGLKYSHRVPLPLCLPCSQELWLRIQPHLPPLCLPIAVENCGWEYGHSFLPLCLPRAVENCGWEYGHSFPRSLWKHWRQFHRWELCTKGSSHSIRSPLNKIIGAMVARGHFSTAVGRFSPCCKQFILYIVYCILYIVYCILYTVYCIFRSIEDQRSFLLWIRPLNLLLLLPCTRFISFFHPSASRSIAD